MELLMPLSLVFAGLFSIVCAVGNWDWFMENRRAALFVSLLGRDGARGAYVLLGVGLAGGGAFLIWMSAL
jgi:hypothetical protein